jgi:bifunctional non-homologous end joining protein LigD
VTETARFGPYTVELVNRDKVLFPADGITKGDLIEYYRRIGKAMLPHARGRPVTMHRFPDGIETEGFYHKEVPDHFPDWIRRVTVPKEGGEITHAICDNVATLVYLANQGCITPHLWLSRADRPRHPDRMIFDLDPATEDFDAVRRAARDLSDFLDELGLAVFLQTTGSRGIHVVVPLDRSAGYDVARAFARDVARVLAGRDPKRLTTEMRKARRRDRIFLDTMRNAYAQTAAAPYSVRPRPGAPVATPIDRAELDDPDLGPRRYTIRNIFRRLARKRDPWAGIGRHARSLESPRRRLDRLLADS